MINMDVLAQIAEILEENYYTLLATGEEAVDAAQSDFLNGFWKNDPDNIFTDAEVAGAIEYLRVKFHIEGKLNVSANHYYTHTWNLSFEKSKG